MTKQVSEVIKEKQAYAESSGVSWTKEHDVLSQCLGPEQPGRVRGVSSYEGWKNAPGWAASKRQRKTSAVDLAAIKEEIRAEVPKDILAMLAAQGLPMHLDGRAAVRLPLQLHVVGPMVMKMEMRRRFLMIRIRIL